MGGLHKNITGSDLHIPGYVQSSDPGAVGTGMYWVDTSGGAGNWVAKIRNAANTDWEDVTGSGGGGGVTDYDELTSYKDLVTLQQSGAGLPSHAGKEAALYDGSGAQILGRTAVRHWLDPHPDAASFAETWEFSTTGDMTQGQLETAGWTFANCTAGVSNGMMWITASSGQVVKASLTVSLTGDFDFWACPVGQQNYNPVLQTIASRPPLGFFGVADTANDSSYYISPYSDSTLGKGFAYHTGAWTTLGGSLEYPQHVLSGAGVRIWRYGGAIHMGLMPSPDRCVFRADEPAPGYVGITQAATPQNNTNTMDRIFLTVYNTTTTTTQTSWYRFIRRFQ